jgi:hypothetical protein
MYDCLTTPWYVEPRDVEPWLVPTVPTKKGRSRTRGPQPQERPPTVCVERGASCGGGRGCVRRGRCTLFALGGGGRRRRQLVRPRRRVVACGAGGGAAPAHAGGLAYAPLPAASARCVTSVGLRVPRFARPAPPARPRPPPPLRSGRGLFAARFLFVCAAPRQAAAAVGRRTAEVRARRHHAVVGLRLHAASRP